MSLNYRVAGDPNAPMYSPERDLAYVFPALIQEVFASLDEKNWDSELRYLSTEHGLTEQMLAEGCGVFAKVCSAFLRDKKVTNLADALETAEFKKQPPLVQVAIFYRLGQATAAGTLVAAKTLTPQFRDGGLQSAVGGMVAAMYQAARQLAGLPEKTEPTEIDPALYWQGQAEMYERLARQQEEHITSLEERLAQYEPEHRETSGVSSAGGGDGVPTAEADGCCDRDNTGIRLHAASVDDAGTSG